MNLLSKHWLKASRAGGDAAYVSPSDISDTNLVDISLPRADFRGAAYQWLIGLLQTTVAPKNVGQWLDWYEQPPGSEKLAKAFEPFAAAFELVGDGPRFMQDFDALEKASTAPVSSLLVDAPGANGIENNTDFFVKRGQAERLCVNCATIALYALQANGPAGGKGYRTGMRGGGPLTTLVLPDEAQSSLWHKLWLNVVPNSRLVQKGQTFTSPSATDAAIFPWMGPTPTSEKDARTQLPEMLHPLHVFWSMPRRFRLVFEEHPAVCGICGCESRTTVAKVRAKAYGINYHDTWKHPLTPYRFDPKKPQASSWSQKGRSGGIDYRHWSAFVFRDPDKLGAEPAVVVDDYIKHKYPFYLDEVEEGETTATLSGQTRIWIYGFDLVNMKARGWTDTQMPLIAVSTARRDVLREWISQCVELAQATAREVSDRIRHAWFKRPKDAGGDTSFIAREFFESTQPDFFVLVRQLREIVENNDSVNFLPSDLARDWYVAVRRAAYRLFDAQAVSGAADLRQMERGARERRWLAIWLAGGAKKSKKKNAVAEFAEHGSFDPKRRAQP